MEQDLTNYITSEETSYKTTKIDVTDNKKWNMYEHIQRMKNLANGWYHTGVNDGNRPYDDLITPIINVAFRSEGFDVKDILPYVNDPDNYYKSFLVKKFHPKWAREIELDTFIDQSVESSVIYDLVLYKNVNNTPEVVPLESIAFCDQTDVLSAPICLKHEYSINDLLGFKGKWFDDKIDEAIAVARSERGNKKGTKNKSAGKYIEVYELHGTLPESWLKDGGDSKKYEDQLQIVTLYTNDKGEKDKIVLFKGKSKPLTEIFDALKIDQVRSYGRACGRSVVETLSEPQVWNNYSAIKIKKFLDSAINIFQTESEEFGNQKLSQLPENTILKHEQGKPITRINAEIQNMDKLLATKDRWGTSARMLGSASEAALGINPVSGTPLGTTENVLQQGQGIHEYRQGKIATFFADRLYKKWFIKDMIAKANNGKRWLDELSLEEMQFIAGAIAKKEGDKKLVEMTIKYFDKKGEAPTQEDIDQFRQFITQEVMKSGNRKFLEVLKDELKDLPVDVMINIAGKQKNFVKMATDLSNIIRTVMANPQAFVQTGLDKPFNQLLESAGLNQVDFNKITNQSFNQPVAQVVQNNGKQTQLEQ